MSRSKLAATAAAGLTLVGPAFAVAPVSAHASTTAAPPRSVSAAAPADLLGGNPVLINPLTTKLLPPLAAVPAVLKVADLNHDGHPDVIVADFGATNSISVFLNKGDGTFKSAVRYTTGGQADYVGVGDFKHNGNLDLVVSNLTTNNVSVLMNRGDGTFDPAVDYPTGVGPGALVVGDFNKDGNLDVATANSEPTISLLRGNPDGTFQPAVTVPNGLGAGGSSIDAADIYGDGNLSLVRGNYADLSISVLRGHGNGTFDPPTYLSDGGVTPWYGLLHDLAGTGRPDMIFDNLASNTISVLRNNGNGVFSAPVSYPTGQLPQVFDFADLRHIGRQDMAVANLGSDTISVYLANGDGTFQPKVDYKVGHLPFSVSFADFYGTGKLDAVVANGGDGTISVLRANGDGTFGSSVSYPA